MLQRLSNKYKQLILIMFVGTNVFVCVVFLWEETRLPKGIPPSPLGDHMSISNVTLGIKPRLQSRALYHCTSWTAVVTLLWKWSNSDCREVEGIMFHPQTTCWYAPVLICIRVGMHPCWYAPVLICTRVDMHPCWYGPVLIWTRVDMHPCWFAPVLICTCDKHERVLEQQVSRI